MAKTILLSYELEDYQALNSNGWTYVLKLEKSYWFFGNRTKQFQRKITIPHRANACDYYDLWNTHIKHKHNIKQKQSTRTLN